MISCLTILYDFQEITTESRKTKQCTRDIKGKINKLVFFLSKTFYMPHVNCS